LKILVGGVKEEKSQKEMGENGRTPSRVLVTTKFVL